MSIVTSNAKLLALCATNAITSTSTRKQPNGTVNLVENEEITIPSSQITSIEVRLDVHNENSELLDDYGITLYPPLPSNDMGYFRITMENGVFRLEIEREQSLT